MARRRARPRRQSAPAPGWVWMLFGLGLGLAVAAAIHFQHRSGAQLPGEALPTAASPPSEVPFQVPVDSPVAAGTSAPARPAPEPSRFQFYEILPQFEVVVPQPEAGHAGAAAAPPRAPAPGAGSYVLQAGSFSRYEDADRMRATLALRGIESFIQLVQIDEHTFHRVRIGPVEDLQQVDHLQRSLREADVEALLIRMPD